MRIKKVLHGIKYIVNPDYRFLINSGRGLYDSWSDEKYIKRKFKAILHFDLCLENPKTFNEKLQWLKLYDRRPIYTTMVDKYKVRELVSERLGKEYLIPLLGVWDNPDDIDFNSLPSQFVLKCNHNSGTGMYICRDKSQMDLESVKRELRKGLNEEYYLTCREWPYKDVPKKIICEKFMTEDSGSDLIDYKIHNFDGEPRIIKVYYDRFVNLRANLYDTNWNYIDGAITEINDSMHIIPKPETLSEMLKCARILSKGTPFMRTDFYSIHGKVLFGEITMYPDAGFTIVSPPAFEKQLSEWLIIH